MNAHTRPEAKPKLTAYDLEGEICDLARLALATDIVARSLFNTLREASKTTLLEQIYSMQDRERELLLTQIEDMCSATHNLRKRLYEVI